MYRAIRQWRVLPTLFVGWIIQQSALIIIHRQKESEKGASLLNAEFNEIQDNIKFYPFHISLKSLLNCVINFYLASMQRFANVTFWNSLIIKKKTIVWIIWVD